MSLRSQTGHVLLSFLVSAVIGAIAAAALERSLNMPLFDENQTVSDSTCNTDTPIIASAADILNSKSNLICLNH